MALSRQLLLIGKRNYDFGVLVFGKVHIHKPPNTIGASLHAIQGPVLVIALEEEEQILCREDGVDLATNSMHRVKGDKSRWQPFLYRD